MWCVDRIGSVEGLKVYSWGGISRFLCWFLNFPESTLTSGSCSQPQAVLPATGTFPIFSRNFQKSSSTCWSLFSALSTVSFKTHLVFIERACQHPRRPSFHIIVWVRVHLFQPVWMWIVHPAKRRKKKPYMCSGFTIQNHTQSQASGTHCGWEGLFRTVEVFR